MENLLVTVVTVLVISSLVVLAVQHDVRGRARRRAEPAFSPVASSSGSGMLGELVEVFQPSREHVTAEVERQRLDMAQRPVEGDPFDDVDLDAGTAGSRIHPHLSWRTTASSRYLPDHGGDVRTT